jgi:hypothetical protein
MVATLESKARLDTPHGIAVAGSGMIFIANMGTHQILAIDRQGNVQSIAGTGEAGPELEQLNKPAAVLLHNGLNYSPKTGQSNKVIFDLP